MPANNAEASPPDAPADQPETGPNDPRIPFVKRPDLEEVEVLAPDHHYWNVKDPLTDRFFRLSPYEHAVLTMMDGRTRISVILEQFRRQFLPSRIDFASLMVFVHQLHRTGLITVDRPGEARDLIEKANRKSFLGKAPQLLNLLAIRLPGFNPDGLLKAMLPWFKWVYTPAAALLAITTVITALVLVLLRWEVFISRLPDFSTLVTFSNLVAMLFSFAAVKLVHEFAHALTCNYYGGRCREMGVLFLVFAPCLYCDVSDAWMLRRKWHRIAISAAGIFVELTIAALFTLLWWFSRDGTLQLLLMNVIIVCSVNTVLFNGNPLLRYDGYYVLADLLNIPNLAPQGSNAVRGILTRIVTGRRSDWRPKFAGGRDFWVPLYGILAAVYRVFVLCAIGWLVLSVAKANDLMVVGITIVSLMLSGVVVGLLVQILVVLRSIMSDGIFRWLRTAIGLVCVGGLGYLGLNYAWPHHIVVPVVLQPVKAQAIYVETSGVMKSTTPPGTPVRKDEILAEFENPELEREIMTLEAERELLWIKLDNLRKLQGSGAETEAIPTVEEQIADLEQQIAQRQREQASLVIVANKDGTMLPPPNRRQEPTDDLALMKWSGTLLDDKNVGAFCEASTLYGYLGNPRDYQAIAVVPQYQLLYLDLKAPVKIQLSTNVGATFTGELVELNPVSEGEIPRELPLTGELAAKQTATGELEAIETSYLARIKFATPLKHTPLYTTGHARISGPPLPLYRRIYRYFSRNFTFNL